MTCSKITRSGIRRRCSPAEALLGYTGKLGVMRLIPWYGLVVLPCQIALRLSSDTPLLIPV